MKFIGVAFTKPSELRVTSTIDSFSIPHKFTLRGMQQNLTDD